MIISRAVLRMIMPLAGARVDTFLGPLNAAMDLYHINTQARAAAFLAQLAHESGELRYVQELASGAAYEGRDDLGNTEVGDGVRYKGRGLIQVTGRANYMDCSLALFDDYRLLDEPALLESPKYAVLSAAWFWKSHNLNALADKGDFKGITRKINGGYNGLADRERYHKRALEALGSLA
jgi:putative chitinase